MDSLEKTILKYLETRPDGWKWVYGTEVLTRDEIVERFKKDKRFRKFIVERAHILAIEMFNKATEGSWKK